MIYAVDTNVLLDILIPASPFQHLSLSCLTRLDDDDQLILCEVVYAELASQFPGPEDLDLFLSDTGIGLVHSNRASLIEAGLVWKRYALRRPKGVVCPVCGENALPECPRCRETIRVRQHILPDFLVGAHAKALADTLITRDRGVYKTYFQRLQLLDPSKK